MLEGGGQIPSYPKTRTLSVTFANTGKTFNYLRVKFYKLCPDYLTITMYSFGGEHVKQLDRADIEKVVFTQKKQIL